MAASAAKVPRHGHAHQRGEDNLSMAAPLPDDGVPADGRAYRGRPANGHTRRWSSSRRLARDDLPPIAGTDKLPLVSETNNKSGI